MGSSEVKSLSDKEKLARFRLAKSQNVGPIAFRQLLFRFGHAEAALKVLPDLAARGGMKQSIRIFPKSEAEKIFEKVEGLGAFLIFLGDKGYPEALAATEDAPPFLVAKGHQHLLGKQTIAIVGTRNASSNGRRMAFEIAQTLGENGLVVVSGLARGIDTHAHQGALETGTVAVLGGGIDVYYPKENRDLQDNIAQTGLILSEHIPGSQPQAQNFPRRNRVISGLSIAVVVVEAALRSGSLITARLASEQGRDVFAVPGHPMDPRAKGPNKLIREGALLVEDAEDVLDALKTTLKTPLSDPTRDLFDGLVRASQHIENIEKYRDIIQQLLGPAPTAIDDIIRQSDLTAAPVLTILLELELAGLAIRHPGNRVSLS